MKRPKFGTEGLCKCCTAVFQRGLPPDRCVRGWSHLSPERLWELGRALAVRAGLREPRPPSGRASWRWRTRRKHFNKEIASCSSVPVVAVNRVGSAPEHLASSSSFPRRLLTWRIRSLFRCRCSVHGGSTGCNPQQRARRAARCRRPATCRGPTVTSMGVCDPAGAVAPQQRQAWTPACSFGHKRKLTCCLQSRPLKRCLSCAVYHHTVQFLRNESQTQVLFRWDVNHLCLAEQGWVVVFRMLFFTGRCMCGQKFSERIL